MRTRFYVSLLSLFCMNLHTTLNASAPGCPGELLTQLNATYMDLHREKEATYWSNRMHLASYVPDSFEAAEKALSDWRSDPGHLKEVELALGQKISDPRVRAGLEQWRAYFEVNSFPDPKLHDLVEQTLKLEATLGEDKAKLTLTYTDPKSGATVPATVTTLRNTVDSEPSETSRSTAWDSLSKLEQAVVDSTYIEIIKKRRDFGKRKGASSFYDYRTRSTEQMSEAEVFAVLDALEASTRAPAKAFVQSVAAKHGNEALKPWNFSYAIRGELDKKIDPYFSFADAVRRWGATFAGMGISYRGGKFIVDLIDRPGKYQNGFIRAREPAYFDLERGVHVPVFATFTSNAVPKKIGAGLSALKTLLHEGGHGAHFANIETPSVAGSQEEPPTSIAGAETHSTLMDHLLYDPIWLKRYAVDTAGNPIPDALIEQMVAEYQASLAWKVRSTLVVPYFERALYSMPDKDLTRDKILKLARDIEKKMLFIEGAGRPVLTVVHTHSSEAAAYYHGYVMAELAVWQTLRYLRANFDSVVDNPQIGPLLAKKYWAPGNAIKFSDMIKNLTGEAFSADAILEFINQTPAEVSAWVAKQLKEEPGLPRLTQPIDLNAKVIIADGDRIIAETSATKSFEQVAKAFSQEIQRREAAAP